MNKVNRLDKIDGMPIYELIPTRIAMDLVKFKVNLQMQSMLNIKDTNSSLCDELINNYNNLLKGIIPESYPHMNYDNYYEYIMSSPKINREHFIDIQGFVLVSRNWVRELAQYLKGKRCLEIMSGLGTLTKALQDEGVDIIATDNYTWPWRNVDTDKYWCDIENIECIEAIEKYKPDVVIMSWCPHESNAGYKALQTMRKVNSTAEMLVCGEGKGGCTADDAFFDSIEIIDNEYIDKANAKFSSWFGIHDYLMLVR